LQITPTALAQQPLAPFAPSGYAGPRATYANTRTPLLGLAQWIASLDRWAPLPATAQGFFLYSLGLIFLVLVAVSHVYLSAQILQAEVQLKELQDQYALVDQQNSELIWQIARETDLVRLQKRIDALGYIPAAEHRYVTVPAAGGLATAPAATPESTQTGALAGLRRVDLWGQLTAYLSAGASGDKAPTFVQSRADRPTVPTRRGSQPHEWWRNWWQQVWRQSAGTLQRLSLR
jgi:hypothetical protein